MQRRKKESNATADWSIHRRANGSHDDFSGSVASECMGTGRRMQQGERWPRSYDTYVAQNGAIADRTHVQMLSMCVLTHIFCLCVY